ncbi:3-oxoacyl-ACP reductase [Longispora fulva]|uniref:3-oxoacyl-[acyl-carrier protein] reductase n=1 Tax=Longispora fulva TaxID=619741 RepID=A0A8J7GNG8_9ACTN|nr:SDR family oxidoreductase [Longispora fulva]MBG6140213.1 3-oxoacyl-[acyl-carrier protein] reductase [Longispora fulva]GIG57410.1 3-oxoacyl-ACP reductase [Longispora fulva]
MRTVVISGGGTGIGLATAHRFARAGEHVILLGRRAEVLHRAVEDIGSGAWYQIDLTDPDAVQGLADQLDRVDVLVNNAGGLDRREVAPGIVGVAQTWERTFALNAMTAILLTEALLPKMTAPGGRIVHVSSIAAHRGNGAYGAAKAALTSWSAHVAREHGPHGITSNVVSPGYVADTEFFAGPVNALERKINETMVKRSGTPDEIAAAIEYLASPAAGYTTGTVLHANGGAYVSW